MTKKYSMGGSIVAASLLGVGFNLENPQVSLVETFVPMSRRPGSVLAQSLWNVLPASAFLRELEPYPKRMQAKAIARREAARINLRSAELVVCLTESMAEYTESFARRTVEVSPVCLPLDVADIPSNRPLGAGDGELLVPGTVTWYKRPHDAVAWAAGRPESEIWRVRLAGADDGSGCLESVRRLARQLDLDLVYGPLTRDEMWDALRRASLVALPSGMESLGFSLGEALWCSRKVVANPIDAHVEVAERVGVAPMWLNNDSASDHQSGQRVQRDEVLQQWIRVGATLGLEAR